MRPRGRWRPCIKHTQAQRACHPGCGLASAGGLRQPAHALRLRQVLRRLRRFKDDADFCRRTGRAHKLGLLLYGPPGEPRT